MQLRLDELLDAGLAVNDLPAELRPGTDLTPFLGSDSAVRDTPTGAAIAGGTAITFGVPWLSEKANIQWFGRRLFVWRHGLPAERLIGICMSRIGRQPEQFKPVFDAIRTAIVRLDVGSETVLVSDQTAAARYVSRAAVLFGRRTLTVFSNCDSKTWSEWWTDAGTFRGNESTERAVAVSPLLSGDDPLDSPLGDRLLIGLAHRSVCVHSRPRGHTHSVLMSRLKSPAWPAGSVFVRRDGDAKSSEELIANGGVGWLILGDVESSATSPGNRAVDQPTYRSFNHADYLTHCTRRYDGPWPGETEQQFLDDLLLDRQGADHSALATLCRIVGQQKLVASSALVRGKTPVVCLSECSAAELVQRRTFRSHRGKWDYEPFGICIRRDWLINHDARMVTYLSQADWPTIDQDEVWHHQTRVTANESADWTDEREWRVRGDLDLSQVPTESAFVFVPDETAAGAVASNCRWPVVVLPANESS